MNARQYQTFKVLEIEAIVEQNWNSLDALHSIAQELDFRSTKQAILLQRKVKHRISELDQNGRSRGASESEKPEDEVLYAKVGLHPSAPSFLIEAARKAFRKNYHPDKYPPNGKRGAEETFKNIDNIFELIANPR